MRLLKQVDERLDLTRAAALALGDDRYGASVQHCIHSLLAQRIYGPCLGWSEMCDHNVLPSDLVMQTAVGCAQPPGGRRNACARRCAARGADAAVHRQPRQGSGGVGA